MIPLLQMAGPAAFARCPADDGWCVTRPPEGPGPLDGSGGPPKKCPAPPAAKNVDPRPSATQRINPPTRIRLRRRCRASLNRTLTSLSGAFLREPSTSGSRNPIGTELLLLVPYFLSRSSSIYESPCLTSARDSSVARSSSSKASATGGRHPAPTSSAAFLGRSHTRPRQPTVMAPTTTRLVVKAESAPWTARCEK